MISKVKLVQSLCVSMVALLGTGDAVAGALHKAAEEIRRDIAAQNPNDEDIRAIQKAISEIVKDGEGISHERFEQDKELERLARSMRANYFAILDKVEGRPSTVIATVAALREDQTRQRDRITEILGHRAQ